MKLGKLASPRFGASLQKLMNMKGVPVKTAFAIRTLARRVQEELQKFDDLRTQYIQEFAEKNEQGDLKVEVVGGSESAVFSKSGQDKFNKKLKDLSDLEVELPEICIDDLGQADGLTPEDVFQLEFIVE